MIREDFIIRLVKQIAAVVRRVAGLRDEGEFQRALDETQRGYEDLLGMPPGLADRVDSATMAQLLGNADKIRAAARLSWEEGHIYKGMADPLTAFQRYRRAHELFLEARAMDPQEDDDNAILELSRVAPASELHPRYRS